MTRARLIFTAFILCGCIARAQDVRVSLALDSTDILIGNWMPARLTITAPKQYRVIIPKQSNDFAHAEIVAGEPESIEDQGGVRRITKSYTLTSFDTGDVAVSATVRYVKPGDTTTYTAVSPSVTVTVRTVRIDTTKSFRDIKDVLHVPLTIWDYLLYLAIALGIAAAGYVGYRWYRRRPAPVVEETPDPEVPADEIALGKLRELEGKRLWEQGDHKGYQSELTGIVREYIERGFHVPALEQITPEIISGIALLGFDPDAIVKLEQALRIADMTKFAKYIPGPPEHQIGLRIVYEFIERTRTRLRPHAMLVEAPEGETRV